MKRQQSLQGTGFSVRHTDCQDKLTLATFDSN